MQGEVDGNGGRTPCEEDVWERDEFEHGAVVVLQVNIGLSC